MSGDGCALAGGDALAGSVDRLELPREAAGVGAEAFAGGDDGGFGFDAENGG